MARLGSSRSISFCSRRAARSRRLTSRRAWRSCPRCAARSRRSCWRCALVWPIDRGMCSPGQHGFLDVDHPFFATVYGRTGCSAVNRPGHDPKPTSRNPADPDRFAAKVAREWQRGDIGGCGQSGRIAQPNRAPRRDARGGTARCKGRRFRRVVREGTLSADHRVRRKAATTTTSTSLARRSTVCLAPALRLNTCSEATPSRRGQASSDWQ